MKEITVKQLADGIFRITDAKYADMLTLTERYSILNPVNETCSDNASYDYEKSILSFGNMKLKLSFRPDNDDDFWSGASAYLLDKFKDKHLNKVVAEGNPNEYEEYPEDCSAKLV